MNTAAKVAVVTGANRGIGHAISRKLAREGVLVVMTSRDEALGKKACADLEAEGLTPELFLVDVTDEAGINALSASLREKHGGLDILVNNAGIAMKGFDADIAEKTLDVNFFGALRTTRALLPAMREGGRIVMVSSGLGDRSNLAAARIRELDDIRALAPRDGIERLSAFMRRFVEDVRAGRHAAEGWPSSAYSMSKIGMNALTELLAREIADDPRGILCNAVCPGWVRTDMGGPQAARSVEEGADTPVWLALLPPGGPSGGFFRDRAPASW